MRVQIQAKARLLKSLLTAENEKMASRVCDFLNRVYPEGMFRNDPSVLGRIVSSTRSMDSKTFVRLVYELNKVIMVPLGLEMKTKTDKEEPRFVWKVRGKDCSAQLSNHKFDLYLIEL
jgi:hypothetical protein